METREVTIEAPWFDGWKCVAYRPPRKGEEYCGDRRDSFGPGAGCICTATHDSLLSFLIYRRVPKPKPEVVCARCGWAGKFSEIAHGGCSVSYGPCPVCLSRLWDYPDARDARHG